MIDVIAKSLGIEDEFSKEITLKRFKVQSENDYEEARETIKQRMTDLEDVIDEVKGLATQAQSPNFYRALNDVIKTSIEASRELLALQRQEVEIEKMTKQPEKGQNVTNNLFVGTTKDLLDLIQKKQNEG